MKTVTTDFQKVAILFLRVIWEAYYEKLLNINIQIRI
jgi:hypothetical protein